MPQVFFNPFPVIVRYYLTKYGGVRYYLTSNFFHLQYTFTVTTHIRDKINRVGMYSIDYEVRDYQLCFEIDQIEVNPHGTFSHGFLKWTF